MKILKYSLFLMSLFLLAIACNDDEEMPLMETCNPSTTGDLIQFPYEPTPFELVVPGHFAPMDIPADNPLTEQGIDLGRHLFYDNILSADSTMACANCHLPEGSFTDNLAVSTGIDDIPGIRSSMSLLNVGYFYTGLFWDGRSTTLEEQALLPVEDPIELHNQWPNLVEKLKIHSSYPEMFRAAFGIEDRSEITKELAAKAIAQFERTLVSSGESDYDRALNVPGVFLSEEAKEGFELFSIEFIEPGIDHPGCSHCHDGVLFTNHNYENNGIDSVGSLADYPDPGLGAITGDMFNNGQFRVPSLINIEHSAPYMHDGRFNTLEEVIDHYATGGHWSESLNPNIQSFEISEEDKAKLVLFLKSLSDPVFMNNPAHQSPF